MSYIIEIRELEPVRVASTHYKGKINEASKYFPGLFKSIKGKACGAPFCCFSSVDEATQTGHVELCVPTEENPETPGIIIKETPRIKALCTTHTGSYEALKDAYQTLQEHIISKKLNVCEPCREIYIKGPGMFLKGNPKNYITEIAIPLLNDSQQGGDDVAGD